jgi:hypothetical protein
MARRILMGEALTAFNNAADEVYSIDDKSDKGTESHDNYQKVILKVAAAVFPIRAYLTQKQAMRRFMRKPKDMKIRDYVARLLEIIGYLEYFPTNTDKKATVLPTDGIMDILTYGIPNSWQKKIVEYNFDAQDHTPNEFVELCERISYGETLNADASPPKAKANSSGEKTVKFAQNPKTKSNLADPSSAKYCPLHKTNSHDAKECKVILAQCKKMASSYESKSSYNDAKRQKTDLSRSSKSEQMFNFMVNAF